MSIAVKFIRLQETSDDQIDTIEVGRSARSTSGTHTHRETNCVDETTNRLICFLRFLMTSNDG